MQNTNKQIRLTQDRQSEKGWLWSRMPLATPNWQMEFEFKVGLKGATQAAVLILHQPLRAPCAGIIVIRL
jgi:hypothetical protein